MGSLLHWEYWSQSHQEESFGFERTHKAHLYSRFLALLNLSLE